MNENQKSLRGIGLGAVLKDPFLLQSILRLKRVLTSHDPAYNT